MSYSKEKIKMNNRVWDVSFLVGVYILLVFVGPLFLLIYAGIKVAEVYKVAKVYMERVKHGKKCKR